MRDPIEAAQERLLATMRAHRSDEVLAAVDGDVRAHHLAREALASVMPQLPGMIDDRVGEANARIYSREDLRRMLADFAVELLIAQQGSVMRWMRAKAREVATTVKGARG